MLPEWYAGVVISARMGKKEETKCSVSERRRCEARRRGSSNAARGSGECCKLPQRVRPPNDIWCIFGLKMLYLAFKGYCNVNAYLQKLPTDCAKSVSYQTDSSAKIQFLTFSITFGNRKKQILPITDMWQSHSPPLRSRPLKSR